MQKTPLMRLKEIEHGGRLEELIPAWYEDQPQWTSVAMRLGIPYATMMDWRRALRIQTIRRLQVGDQAATDGIDG